ncbi:MAG: hypothetical protein U0324_34140 [Polyangiales bacterium]
MPYEDLSGNRFELLLHPSVTSSPGAHRPFASPESFLTSFSPQQRADMLRRVRANPGSVRFDVVFGPVAHADPAPGAELARLVREGQLAWVDRGPDPALALRSGGDTAGAGTDEAGSSQQPPNGPHAAPTQEIVCELMAAQISCAHKGRKANRAGLLEVVPGRDDDRIKLEAQLRGGCGKHPKWEITAPGVSETKTGASSSFTARNWGFKLLGIFEVMPKSYYVYVGCCSGMSRRFEVKTYPIDQWAIIANIDFKQRPTQWVFEARVTPWDEAGTEDTGLKLKSGILKALTDKKQQLDYVLEKMLKPLLAREPEWEFFKTKLTFKGQWAEHEPDHRCFYKFEASLSLDPLIKGTFTIPFGPTGAIPPWIKKWTTDLIGDLYLYVQFYGEVGLKGKWSRTTPDTSAAEASGSGKVGVKVGGNLFLMKRSALNLDVNGGTEITAEVTAPVERKPAVAFDLKWGGIEIELTIEAAWGMVEYKRKWKAVEGGSFFKQPKVWHPLGEAA